MVTGMVFTASNQVARAVNAMLMSSTVCSWQVFHAVMQSATRSGCQRRSVRSKGYYPWRGNFVINRNASTEVRRVLDT